MSICHSSMELRCAPSACSPTGRACVAWARAGGGAPGRDRSTSDPAPARSPRWRAGCGWSSVPIRVCPTERDTRASMSGVIWCGQLSGFELLSARAAMPRWHSAAARCARSGGSPRCVGPLRSPSSRRGRRSPLDSAVPQSELHQHGRPPSVPSTTRPQRRRWLTATWWTLQARSVKQVPEPVSPRYRSRDPESVKQVPEPRCQA